MPAASLSIYLRKDSGQLKPNPKKPEAIPVNGRQANGQGYQKESASGSDRPGIVVLMAGNTVNTMYCFPPFRYYHKMMMSLNLLSNK